MEQNTLYSLPCSFLAVPPSYACGGVLLLLPPFLWFLNGGFLLCGWFACLGAPVAGFLGACVAGCPLGAGAGTLALGGCPF